MILKTIVAVGAATAAVGTVLGAGWGANKYLATKDELLLAESRIEKVQAQVTYTQNRDIAAAYRELGRYEGKRVKTQDDRDYIKYLRESIKEMQEVRKGK